ncbi:MAG: 1-acyl-sn-glycerol-3-phosphate acyltransferase [Leptospiraceae bacterium]|nr:1-acyl-sn-glycerol-3-phosphate acyltransferase [Leptospiraceae bacterium]
MNIKTEKQKMQQIISTLSNNTIHTPPERKRIFWDRLFFGSRIYFIFRYIYITYVMSTLAKANKYHDEEFLLHSYSCYKLLEDVGAKFTIEGIDNLRKVKDEPVVFISNHMSTLETMVFPIVILPFKKAIFVVKKSLLNIILFGHCIRATNPIALGRVNPREDLKTVLDDGTAKLNKGTSVIIFQQGNRNPHFDPEKFSSIGVKLAQKAGVRIVPIALKTDFWGNGKWLKDFGQMKRNEKVCISFGEPMTIVGNGKDINPKIISFIQSKLNEWGHTK